MNSLELYLKYVHRVYNNRIGYNQYLYQSILFDYDYQLSQHLIDINTYGKELDEVIKMLNLPPRYLNDTLHHDECLKWKFNNWKVDAKYFEYEYTALSNNIKFKSMNPLIYYDDEFIYNYNLYFVDDYESAYTDFKKYRKTLGKI